MIAGGVFNGIRNTANAIPERLFSRIHDRACVSDGNALHAGYDAETV